MGPELQTRFRLVKNNGRAVTTFQPQKLWNTEGRADIYQRITDSIAAAIEKGAGEWRMPWHSEGAG